ncbi:isochorismatase family protein [Cupriavidus alkaliphilus]|uniref:isochorismatase family protein n=1 Tax=Cupriavidus alkaliphilus TaxID=942866 RepID=UPI000DE5D04D|nr:isochorismatase family protein [Cupriavidus alkaliphilus]PVY79843.1 isochorismatase family protein [Cupriavidus alkaliphilus]
MTCALVIIDFQAGLVNSAPLPGDAVAVAGNINTLSSRARQAGVPVIFIQHENEKALRQGSSAWQLSAELQVERSDYRIGKRTPDSFLSTEIQTVIADAID